MKEVADSVLARQQSKPPNFTESLYTRDSFKREFQSGILKDETLSPQDIDVLIRYLERDRGVLLVTKEVIASTTTS